MGIRDRLAHAWNAFVTNDRAENVFGMGGAGEETRSRQDRPRMRLGTERSIIASIYNRLAIDVASVGIRHVRLDENERYLDDIDSGLNNCLMVEANIDQGASAFRQDMAMTLFEAGVIAVVPVDTTLDPRQTGSWDVKTMRVGTVIGWGPTKVRVSLYDERDGKRKEIPVDKSMVAIVENPLYTVMNEPNSTLQRLIRKLNLLDAVDEQSSSGKLDLIIQLPYVIKSDARREAAEQRRKDIEFQLSGSKYGIAYADGTEKITQLNRPAENNLLKQVEYLTAMLYGQLGLTEEVMNGTADEATMLNYWNRTIEPILRAITEAMARTFLTKTARSQLQSIMYFRDPFKLVPITTIAEIVDKFTRNEVASANEMRQVIGMKPSKDPEADKLKNSNMPTAPPGQPGQPQAPSGPDNSTPPNEGGDSQNGS